MYSDETFIALIETLRRAELQNSFMRLTDRDVAISLSRLDEEFRLKVFSCLPEGKTTRIKEEMELIRYRLKVPEDKYRQILNHVISVLQGRSRGSINSYIKPKGRR